MCAVLLVLAWGCGAAEIEAPPEEILGTWRTDAPGYERSFLRVEADRVTIGMGTFDLFVYPIERVELTTDRRGHDRYALHYDSVDGYSDSIELTIESANPTTLTMKHPPHPWRRDP